MDLFKALALFNITFTSYLVSHWVSYFVSHCVSYTVLQESSYSVLKQSYSKLPVDFGRQILTCTEFLIESHTSFHI